MLLAQVTAADPVWTLETFKGLLNLGTAGLLLIGLLVVARVFGALWVQMRSIEDASLKEARVFLSDTMKAGHQLSETLRMSIVDVTRLAEMMRTAQNSHNNGNNKG